MARIGSRDTTPERVVRWLAHALGYPFPLHRRDLRGSPDLVFVGRRKVVFVHGCFWHRHPGCARARTPKSRIAFWSTKFARNVARDAEAERRLRLAGWEVLTIWECETLRREALALRLSDFLGPPPTQREQQAPARE